MCMGTYISFGDFCKICFKSKDFKGTAECVQKKNSGIFYRRAENTVSEESKRDLELDLQKYSGRTGI